MNFQRHRDPIRSLNIGRYIYDNGFGPRWYVCSTCKGIKLERRIKGGFQPPDYVCNDCGEISYAPVWISLNPKTGEPYKDNNIKFKHPGNGIRKI